MCMKMLHVLFTCTVAVVADAVNADASRNCSRVPLLLLQMLYHYNN